MNADYMNLALTREVADIQMNTLLLLLLWDYVMIMKYTPHLNEKS